jgi:hypothetical protein
MPNDRPRSFRLSEYVDVLIRRLAELHGWSKTEVVERAVRQMAARLAVELPRLPREQRKGRKGG